MVIVFICLTLSKVNESSFILKIQPLKWKFFLGLTLKIKVTFFGAHSIENVVHTYREQDHTARALCALDHFTWVKHQLKANNIFTGTMKI
jgi:hypothetical protein